MNRQEIVLAALSANGGIASYEPVHVQKLLFLIDREISADVDGPHFNFQPYDYGPFDSAVYQELERLERAGLVRIAEGYYRSYGLTDEGRRVGNELFNILPERARTYITDVAQWVRSVSFSQLISAIYKRYPEMKSASVFRG